MQVKRDRSNRQQKHICERNSGEIAYTQHWQHRNIMPETQVPQYNIPQTHPTSSSCWKMSPRISQTHNGNSRLNLYSVHVPHCVPLWTFISTQINKLFHKHHRLPSPTFKIKQFWHCDKHFITPWQHKVLHKTGHCGITETIEQIRDDSNHLNTVLALVSSGPKIKMKNEKSSQQSS